VTSAAKESEQDNKDTDATSSCPSENYSEIHFTNEEKYY